MKVFSLFGIWKYEGQDLLGVFGSLEDLMKFVESERESCACRKKTLDYDELGYVASELGSKVNFLGQLEYL